MLQDGDAGGSRTVSSTSRSLSVPGVPAAPSVRSGVRVARAQEPWWSTVVPSEMVAAFQKPRDWNWSKTNASAVVDTGPMSRLRSIAASSNCALVLVDVRRAIASEASCNVEGAKEPP